MPTSILTVLFGSSPANASEHSISVALVTTTVASALDTPTHRWRILVFKQDMEPRSGLVRWEPTWLSGAAGAQSGLVRVGGGYHPNMVAGAGGIRKILPIGSGRKCWYSGRLCELVPVWDVGGDGVLAVVDVTHSIKPLHHHQQAHLATHPHPHSPNISPLLQPSPDSTTTSQNIFGTVLNERIIIRHYPRRYIDTGRTKSRPKQHSTYYHL